MNRRTKALAAIVLSAASFGACEFSNVAVAADPPVIGPAPSPLPYCGGQDAAPQPVPYRCATKLKLIATRQVWAEVFADGTSVTVTFHVLNPAPVPVPVVIVHHEGNSGAGLALDSAQGVMAPGQADITVVDSSPCRVGQLDIKYAFTGNGQDQGRVGGPWIENGTGCTDTVTVPTSVPPPSTNGSAPSSSVATSSPSLVTASPSGGGASSQTLPATGGEIWVGLLLAGLLGSLGFLVLIVRRVHRDA